jgi:hypothetical protein
MSTEPKTKRTNEDVDESLAGVADEKRRGDAQKVCRLMREVTGEPGAMWGSSIVGFGNYHYKYASGREGNWMRIGLSPRKTALTLYLMSSYEFKDYQDLLPKLGPHSIGKGCLYIKSLDDVDLKVLKELITKSFQSKAIGEV